MGLFNFEYVFPSSIEEIDQFSNKDFIVFLFKFFEVLGYNPIITDDTNIKGIDLTIQIPSKNSFRNIGIQAKRTTSNVGPNEIIKMLDGRKHFNLDELWIITTSDFTSSAVTAALNHKVEMITREKVVDFLKELEKYNVKKTKVVKMEITEDMFSTEDALLFNLLRQLRISLAKEHGSYPPYIVYDNRTIKDIIHKKPTTIDELYNVYGFGEVKTPLYGQAVVDVVSVFINSYKEALIGIRKDIYTKYALENEQDAFNDSVLIELSKKLPKTLFALGKIDGFPKANIKLFGNYLIDEIKQITQRLMNQDEVDYE